MKTNLMDVVREMSNENLWGIIWEWEEDMGDNRKQSIRLEREVEGTMLYCEDPNWDDFEGGNDTILALEPAILCEFYLAIGRRLEELKVFEGK